MWKTIDKAISTLLRWLFRPRFFVARAEQHRLPSGTRTVKWCTAPANASDAEMRRIFAKIDAPESECMAVWFYTSLKDIGKRPYDIALLERNGRGQKPTITRAAGHRKEVTQV